MNKSCGHCKQIKPITEFFKNRSTKSGYTSYCILCLREAGRNYAKKRRKLDPVYAQKARESNRISKLKAKYNLSEEQYLDMVNSHNGLCAICSKPQPNKRLAVDHNHNTGKIRGLLCEKCNTSIGKLNTIELLQAAIDYLIKNDN